MKKLLLALTILFSLALQAQTDKGIIIKIKKEYTLAAANPDSNLTGLDKINGITETSGFTSFRQLKLGKKSQDVVFRIGFPENADIPSIIEKYRQSGMIEYAEPDYSGSCAGVKMMGVNDAFYSRQWGLKNNGTFELSEATEGADIKMEQAWEIQQGSSDIIVAVMDTGINVGHPEFAGRIWVNTGEIAGNGIDDDENGLIDDVNGWDYANNDNDITDDHGHGINVAGIIAANGDNAIGYSGVDRNCKVMALKGLGSNGFGLYSWWSEAIIYAADNGADVINLSVGGPSVSALLQSAINYAISNNVVVVACMMNNNNGISNYPASYPGVIAVGSTDPDDTRSAPFFWSGNSGSNFGTHISVVAPGNFIYGLSHLSDTDYEAYWGGTSQATPHVVGIASLLRAQRPGLTPAEVKYILETTAEDQVGNPLEDTEGFDIYYGHGRVNAYAALQASLSVNEPATAKNVVIYPNPSKGTLNINPLTYPAKAVVYNTLGQMVCERDITASGSTISIAKAGIYMVTVTSGTATHSETIIIE